MALARPFQIALLLWLTTGASHALQLGETPAQITARHGAPATEDRARQRAVYRWSGWSADLEFQDGVVGLLTYQTSHALSADEIQALLQANGGVDRWHETTRPGAPTRQWRRDDQAAAEQAQTSGLIFRLSPPSARPAEPPLTASVPPSATAAEAPTPPPPLLRTSAELRPEPAVAAPSIVVATSPAVVIGPSPAASGGKMGVVGCLAAALTLLAGALLVWRKRTASIPAPSANPPPTPLPATPPEPPPSAAPMPGLSTLREDRIALLLGEIFRRQGYTVEISAALSGDDGSDLTLRRDGESIPVRSQDWKAARVSEREVREFYGLMAGTAAPRGILVTTGTFSRDARAFAEDKSIELLDRAALDQHIAAIRRPGENFLDVSAWLEDFAAAARIFDPECPCCGQSMSIRRHRTVGSETWVCSTYPRCSGQRAARPDLLALPVAA